MSKRNIIMGLLIGMFLIGGGCLWGEEKLVSINAKDVPLEKVLKDISNQAEVNVIVNPKDSRKVSVVLYNVKWQDAVEIIAKQYDYTIDKKSDTLWYLYKPPKITMHFKDADIRTVLSLIARKAGWNIVMGEEVKGKISVDLDGVPWQRALDVIVKLRNYVWVEESDKIIRVTTPSRLSTDLITEVIRLNYALPRGEEYEAKLEQTNYAVAKSASGDSQQSFALLDILNKMKSKAGRISYDYLNNSLIITDTPKKLQEMKKVIKALDKRPAQLLVEAKLVTISTTDLEELGTEWENGILIQNDSELGFGKLEHIPFPFNFGRNPASNDTSREGQSKWEWRYDVEPGNIITGTALDLTQMHVVMQLLKSKSSTRIIQAPRIVTLDNQKATIHIGSQIRYAEKQVTQSDSGFTISYSEGSNSPVDLGIQLMIIPHIIAAKDEVMMTVIPLSISLDLTQPADTDSDGFLEFGDNELLLPLTKSKILVTKMILKSGYTGVIGGLRESTKTESSKKVPFFGDIPLLNFFFKNRSERENSRELLIFITPYIIKGNEVDQFKEDINKLKEIEGKPKKIMEDESKDSPYEQKRRRRR